MLSDWSKKDYGISFNAISIAREMKKEEINDEVVEVIECIEINTPFDGTA